jgi:hypothetical protein
MNRLAWLAGGENVRSANRSGVAADNHGIAEIVVRRSRRGVDCIAERVDRVLVVSCHRLAPIARDAGIHDADENSAIQNVIFPMARLFTIAAVAVRPTGRKSHFRAAIELHVLATGRENPLYDAEIIKDLPWPDESGTNPRSWQR